MGSTMTVSNDNKRQTSRRLVRQRPTATATANSCSYSCRRRNDNHNHNNGRGLQGFHCRMLSWLCVLLLLAASATASTDHVSYLRRQRGKPLNQEVSAAAAVSATTGTTNGDNNNKIAENTTQRRRRRLRNEMQRRRRAIIGGTTADPYRYPAVVFLADREDDLSCGGTLISPTVVLTAGHCQLSLVIDVVFARDTVNDSISFIDNSTEPTFLLDSNNNNHTAASQPVQERSVVYERIKVKQELIHPLFDSASLRYDIMLLQLEHAPTLWDQDDTTDDTPPFPYMRLDTGMSLQAIEDSNATTSLPTAAQAIPVDPRVDVTLASSPSSNEYPQERNDDVLLALGWGHTKSSRVGIGQPSDNLQKAGLGFVPNQECSQAQEGIFLTYNDRIFEDMMCTFAPNRDSCYGDSGGPIIVPGETPEEDVQVGIVSWGEDCADPIFPGVASRVSFGYSWIREWVCALDGDNEETPTYFECEENATFSPAPTQAPMMPTLSPAPTIDMVPITVNIHFDVFADEIAWVLIDFDTKEAMAQRSYGYYKHENEVRETVLVRPGHVYTFTIKDVYGDGIAESGYYQIYVSDEDGSSDHNESGMIVSPARFTGREQQRTFLVPYPLPSQDNPSGAPSTRPSTSPSVEPSEKPNPGDIDFSNDVGRLCISTGHFCRDSESCCSSFCHSGFCMKSPASRNDQRIHHIEGLQGGP